MAAGMCARSTTDSAAAAVSTGSRPAREVEIAVVGAGFGGLGAAVYLQRAGIHDFVLLERSPGVRYQRAPSSSSAAQFRRAG